MQPVPPSFRPTVPTQQTAAPSAAAPGNAIRPALRPGLRPPSQPPAAQQQAASSGAVAGGAQQKKKPRKAAQWEEQARAAANAAAVALGFPGAAPCARFFVVIFQPPRWNLLLEAVPLKQLFLCHRLHRCSVCTCQCTGYLTALGLVSSARRAQQRISCQHWLIRFDAHLRGMVSKNSACRGVGSDLQAPRRRAQARAAAQAVGDAVPGRPGGAGAAAHFQVPGRHQAPPQRQARGCKVILKLLASVRSG